MNTVSYEDLGSPVVAGQYAYRDKLVDVGASQVSEWIRNPELRFRLIQSLDNRYDIEPIEGSVPA
jgi:hypothetical protein